MLSLFKSKPLLDDTSQQWLFDCFDWAFHYFDGDFFANNSQLVLPTNEFFPGRANTMHGLAEDVFDNIKRHTGLHHWPFKLVAPAQYVPQHYQLKNSLPVQRGDGADPERYQMMLGHAEDRLAVSYDPIQINQPQVMVANFVATLSGYLTGVCDQAPPGGPEYRLPAVEVLAIFMGFGVMFANTAYAFRGGCSSCHNHAANRVAVLTEDESVFALALFCRLKGIDNKKVLPHLKSHLRGVYKQAMNNIKQQPEQLNRLEKHLPLEPQRQQLAAE